MKSFSAYNFYYFPLTMYMYLHIRLSDYGCILWAECLCIPFPFPLIFSTVCKIYYFEYTLYSIPLAQPVQFYLKLLKKKIKINLHVKLLLTCTFMLQYLIWLIFNQGSLCLSTLHFICLVTSHWSGGSVSLGTLLPAPFILITQTDLVYHQQFGLVYSRSFCLGDKLSFLVHEDVWGTFWRWPPEQTLYVVVFGEFILISLPFTRPWGVLLYKLLKRLLWDVSIYLWGKSINCFYINHGYFYVDKWKFIICKWIIFIVTGLGKSKLWTRCFHKLFFFQSFLFHSFGFKFFHDVLK